MKWIHNHKRDLYAELPLHWDYLAYDGWSLQGILDGWSLAAMLAAKNGHVSVLQWMKENRCGVYGLDWWTVLLDCTCLDYLKWERMIDLAGFLGYTDVYDWLGESGVEGRCPWNVMGLAARSGHLAVVQWYYDQIVQCAESARRDGGAQLLENCICASMAGAATNGHLDIVKWLYHANTNRLTVNKARCVNRAMSSAVSSNQLIVVQWLYATGDYSGCTKNLSDFAGRKCHHVIAHWLDWNGQCRWNASTDNGYCTQCRRYQ